MFILFNFFGGKSPSRPRKEFELGALAFGEHKEVARAGILPEVVGNQAAEAFVALAHVDGSDCNKHAGGGTCGDHREGVSEAKRRRHSVYCGQRPVGISKTIPPARAGR